MTSPADPGVQAPPARDDGPPDPDEPRHGAPFGARIAAWPLVLLAFLGAAIIALGALARVRQPAGAPSLQTQPADEGPPAAKESAPAQGRPNAQEVPRVAGNALYVLLAAGVLLLLSLVDGHMRWWLLPPPRLAPRSTWGVEQFVCGVALVFAFVTAAGDLFTGESITVLSLANAAAQLAACAAVTAMVLSDPHGGPAFSRAPAEPDASGPAGTSRRVRLASLGLSFGPAREAGAIAFRGLIGSLATFPLAFVAIYVGIRVSEWRGVPPPIHPIIRQLTTAGAAETILLVALAVVAAPVVEEFFFRGFVYPWLRDRWGMLAGVAVSSIAFAMVHEGIPNMAATLVLGAAFALLYERSGSLLAPVVAHATFNGVQLALSALASG